MEEGEVKVEEMEEISLFALPTLSLVPRSSSKDDRGGKGRRGERGTALQWMKKVEKENFHWRDRRKKGRGESSL